MALGVSHRLPSTSARRTVRALGFSFVELLFAVAVMGLGFIMIAAVFPVGLQQTKLNMDETTSAANARGAIYQLNLLAQSTFQYHNIGTTPTAADVTALLPLTYTGTVPTAGLMAGQLAAGQSMTLAGSLRSFHDPRPFPDTAMTPANFNLRREAIWNKIAPVLINGSDPRNASVLMYKRDLIATNVNATIVTHPSNTVEIVCINAQANAASSFVDLDVKSTNLANPPALYNLEPRPIAVLVTPQAAENDWTITFDTPKTVSGIGSSAPSNTATYTQAYAAIPDGVVAEGMFVVIADDNVTNNAVPFKDVGRLNGHIYRVGVLRKDLDSTGRTYQLAPGYEMSLDPGDSGQLNDTAHDDIVGLGSTAANTPGVSGTFNGFAYNGTNIRYNGEALAYVLGRGFSQVGVVPAAVGDFSGGAQDVSAYTTFLTLSAGQP